MKYFWYYLLKRHELRHSQGLADGVQGIPPWTLNNDYCLGYRIGMTLKDDRRQLQSENRDLLLKLKIIREALA